MDDSKQSQGKGQGQCRSQGRGEDKPENGAKRNI